MLECININDIIIIARNAGNKIMHIYSQEFKVTYKNDKSPLTEADEISHDMIIQGLSALSVKIPILSEEGHNTPYSERKEWDYFWMIDPLDGTKEFINKNGDFTINIALIHKNKSILGVVYAPAFNEMYYAVEGKGAFKNGQRLPLERNHQPQKILRVIASKSHLNAETQEYIDQLAKTTDTIKYISRGSSLKICMVAEGSADIYPRLAPTMEWDVAAAQTIAVEAGKCVIQFEDNKALTYNKMSLLNPWFIVK